jgi:V-type H+-transporting ATPase subunit a
LLESLEVELEGYESQLKELNAYSEKLTREYNEKVELQEVLEKARRFFMTDAPRLAVSELSGGRKGTGSNQGLLAGAHDVEARDLDMRFSSITGVVSTDEKVRFERMIFRATRGNCYVRFAPIKQPITDPETGSLIEKCVFIVFFKSLAIETKLKKICDAFLAHRYSLPDMDDAPSVDRMLTENAQELVDSRTVLLKNQDTRFRLCQMLAQHTERWTWIVLREKAIYHTLNMFKADVSGMLRGEGWVISESFEDIRSSVNRAHSDMDSNMPSHVDQVPKVSVLRACYGAFFNARFKFLPMPRFDFFHSRGLLLLLTSPPTSSLTVTKSLSTPTVSPGIERPTLPCSPLQPSPSYSESCTVISDTDSSSSAPGCTSCGMRKRTTRPN